MKPRYRLLVLAAVLVGALSASAQTGANVQRSLPTIRVKKGCCACAKRWSYPQTQNPSLRLVEGQKLSYRVLPDASLDAYISVENVSASPVRFGVRIDTSRKEMHHRVNFCSGMACYPSFVLESDEQGQVTLQPGQADHTFKLQFDPQGYLGTSTIGVVIYNIADLSDYVTFDVTFEATTQASVDQPVIAESVVPNPASDHIRIRGTVGSRVEIVDALGRCVRSLVLPSDEAAVSVAELPSGAYRVILRSGDRASSFPLQIVR
ncbi:MAG: hypothetical protein AA908_08340 [Chlorobi bacterium NICIL-2]|jgi:hypothetical protein|nr:MAG: hypothetical protein AA908_08340 [Chlorobi bacterium NICIL-2]GBD04756.1 hypothetical protein HRbin20_00325 [bacterium HR20]GIV55580.1 MAG: hypothetical protein KatS3mg040_0348 [Candidatus Kapabacteria bacterium]